MVANIPISIQENKPIYKPKSNGSLDTLAQLGTNLDFDLEISANTNLSDKQNLTKRARRKYLSNGIVLALVDASKINQKSSLRKSYWNSYHCARTLQLSTDNKIKGCYCKTRWCMVCNAIRTAQSINKYSSTIKKWGNAQFLTLTAETVEADKLNIRLDLIVDIIREIKDIHKKRKRRNKTDFELLGIRKIECTYNWKTKKYHPHTHIICNCEKSAKFLLHHWIKKVSARGIKVDIKAQDIRPCDDRGTIELFKYFTKVVTKLPSGESRIDGKSLDFIFNAMKERRTIQPFGFRLPKAPTEESTPTKSQVLLVYTWNQKKADWFDDMGNELSGYTPSSKFTNFASNGKGFDGFEDKVEELRKDSIVINTITRNDKTISDSDLDFM